MNNNEECFLGMKTSVYLPRHSLLSLRNYLHEDSVCDIPDTISADSPCRISVVKDDISVNAIEAVTN